MLSLHTILHPTDFSERSDHAFRYACALARDHGARLIVLHVMPIPLTDKKRGYREEMAGELDRLAAPDPKIHLKRRLEEGDPVAQILRVAHETGCDLIVLGTHGRTGLDRLLMGSVAEQVLRLASCPVLTVKVPFSRS
jgi:nucleotide-binding universal stress UspA family protein